MRNILYINHKENQCGVYQYGRSIGNALAGSEKYNFIYCELRNLKELQDQIKMHHPACVIFNYHPATVPWIDKKTKYHVKAPFVGTIHEVTQQLADKADDHLFDYHIAPDPTLLLRNPIVYKTGRLINKYAGGEKKLTEINTDDIIGSFGFGTAGKGFEKIIEQTQNEYDEATIRLNIPFAEFGDKDGANARKIAEDCRKLVTKKGINLVITHDFWDNAGLGTFLNSNSINVFFYEEGTNRGLSSTIDFALGVDRPIAVTKSSLFRHIRHTRPSICIEDSGLKEIIKNGTKPLLKFKREWTPENTLWEYERIVDSILSRSRIKRVSPFIEKLEQKFGKKKSKQAFTWIRNDEAYYNEEATFVKPITFSGASAPKTFNRILDDFARNLYAHVVEQMVNEMPNTMAKKIPEANVQQAFVLDTVYTFIKGVEYPKILCVGSYESTDAMFLKKAGYEIDEIDPVLNYSLEEFFTKPSTQKNSYDIIFSTSVIEHVENDSLFVKQIGELLKPDGIGIITCDFKEGFKNGDSKPAVDYRFYTQLDFIRFMKNLPGCVLVDEPHWDCPKPDFNYGGYNYTFATFCFRKQ